FPMLNLVIMWGSVSHADDCLKLMTTSNFLGEGNVWGVSPKCTLTQRCLILVKSICTFVRRAAFNFLSVGEILIMAVSQNFARENVLLYHFVKRGSNESVQIAES